MKKILGFVILTEAELTLRDLLAAQKLELAHSQLSVQTELAKKALNEIDFYRRRYEEALDRADRQLDALMTSNGLPEVTTTGRKETSEREQKAIEIAKEKEKELGELYSDMIDMLHDAEGLELPEELKAESEQLVSVLSSEESESESVENS
jgi:hypothetical protein